LANLQRTVYPHSGHPLAEGRAQDRVSSPSKDRRSANCAMQPTATMLSVITPEAVMVAVWRIDSALVSTLGPVSTGIGDR